MHVTMRNIATAVLMLTWIESASAAPIPEHDVERACSTLVDRTLVAACIRSEQSNYDYVKSIWPALSSQRQTLCSKFSEDLGANYYAFYKALANLSLIHI